MVVANKHGHVGVVRCVGDTGKVSRRSTFGGGGGVVEDERLLSLVSELALPGTFPSAAAAAAAAPTGSAGGDGEGGEGVGDEPTPSRDTPPLDIKIHAVCARSWGGVVAVATSHGLAVLDLASVSQYQPALGAASFLEAPCGTPSTANTAAAAAYSGAAVPMLSLCRAGINYDGSIV